MSSLTIECWGCFKSKKYDYVISYDDIEAKLISQGWCRRLFGSSANPWFCSEKCARHSHNALTAEQWWKNNA